MLKALKRVLSLTLAILMVLGAFTACGNNANTQETTEPVATEDPAEAKVLNCAKMANRKIRILNCMI